MTASASAINPGAIVVRPLVEVKTTVRSMYQTCVKDVLAYSRRAFSNNAHHCRPEAAAGRLSTLILRTSPGVFIQVHNHQPILHASAINPGTIVVRQLVEVKTTVRSMCQTCVKGVRVCLLTVEKYSRTMPTIAGRRLLLVSCRPQPFQQAVVFSCKFTTASKVHMLQTSCFTRYDPDCRASRCGSVAKALYGKY